MIQAFKFQKHPPYLDLLNFDKAKYPVPLAFSSRDHCSLMEVVDGTQLNYIGSGHGDNDPATARSECEISPQCGIFYFEIKVVDKGRDGFLAVGLITKSALLKKLVGWEAGTIGYHGDDGFLYLGSGKGTPFGPTYSAGDVVGCGVNFNKKTVFFTKNGQYIGDRTYPLDKSSEYLFAGFGMKSPGESGKANFGFSKFAFDIEGYIKAEKSAFLSLVSSGYSDVAQLEPPMIQILVLEHLVHTGCEEAALTFFRTAVAPLIPFEKKKKVVVSEESIMHALGKSKRRKELIRMVLDCKLEELLLRLELEYPRFLQQNPEIEFILKTALFVELNVKLASNNGQACFERLLKVGHQLEMAEGPFDEDRKKHARDALAMIAYKDPEQSPSAYLLSEGYRIDVAGQLEDTLLALDGYSVASPLENLMKGLVTNLEYLKETGSTEVSMTDPSAVIGSP